MSKQHANHLLNFRQQARPQQPQQYRRNNNSNRKRSGSDAATTRVRGRTNYYLNSSALHRFRLASGSTSTYDLDVGSSWSDICSVLEYVHNEDPPRCPICLDRPVGAVSPICGHVFCASCIIACKTIYIAANDAKKVNECPVCHQDNLSELRPVEYKFCSKISCGDVMSFEKISQKQSRFVGVESLESYRDFVNNLCAEINNSDADNVNESVSLINSIAATFLTKIKANKANSREGAATNSNSFYYQSADGQPYFLGPFTLSIVKADGDKMPTSISNVKIVEIKQLTLSNDQQSRKASFLDSFMPRNATISLVDVNIKNCVQAVTFNRFKKKIDDRARQRTKDKQREVKEDRKMKRDAEKDQRQRLQEQRRQQNLFSNDSFFQSTQTQGSVGGDFVNERLPPASSSGEGSGGGEGDVHPPTPPFSFSSVVNSNFDKLNLSSDDAFPSLGG